MELSSSVTPLPLAWSTATPSSCEPAEPTPNIRPWCWLKSSATTGGPPLTCVGADVALIVTFRAIVGSGLARVMVPFTQNVIRDEPAAGTALAERMAARREPDPASFRLLTASVCVDSATLQVAAWATPDPAVKATAAETPASKPAAPAIRGTHRPARIIRLFMKTIRRVRENFIIINRTSFPRFRRRGVSSLKYAQLVSG